MSKRYVTCLILHGHFVLRTADTLHLKQSTAVQVSLHDYSQIQIVDAVTEQEEDEVANPIKILLRRHLWNIFYSVPIFLILLNTNKYIPGD